MNREFSVTLFSIKLCKPYNKRVLGAKINSNQIFGRHCESLRLKAIIIV